MVLCFVMRMVIRMRVRIYCDKAGLTDGCEELFGGNHAYFSVLVWIPFALSLFCSFVQISTTTTTTKKWRKNKSYKQAQAEINANKNIIIKFYSILLLLCLIESSYECVHLPFPGCECLSFERKDVGGKD